MKIKKVNHSNPSRQFIANVCKILNQTITNKWPYCVTIEHIPPPLWFAYWSIFFKLQDIIALEFWIHVFTSISPYTNRHLLKSINLDSILCPLVLSKCHILCLLIFCYICFGESEPLYCSFFVSGINLFCYIS